MALELLVTFAVCAAYGLWQRAGCQDKDFISELPDDILSYIVSHLNIGDAARTTLLSRRWRKFAADIDQWLSFGVAMGVRELDLCCSCKAGSCLPRDPLYVFSFNLIANSSKLNLLRLGSCTISTDFNGQFHSLCILDLSYILLSQTDVQYILLTCVNLEQLRLYSCELPTNLSICGPLVRLKILTLEECSEIPRFELSASSLITFETSQMVRPSLYRVPCLKNCFLDMRGQIFSYLYGGSGHETNRDGLESLSLLCPHGFPECKYEPRHFRRKFSNVKHLALYFGVDKCDNGYAILDILRACPLLEKFHLMLMGHPVDEMCILPSALVEEPHLTALKEVEFGGFHGSKKQIRLVTYLIENAVSLERLVLSTGYRSYRGFGKFTYGCKITMHEVKRRWILYRLERKALSSRAQVKIQVNN